jgi:rare lipoprotein A
MRQNRLLKVFAAAALVGSCASAAMITPPADSRPDEETGVTLTPVVVEADGRMTARPVPVRSADPATVRSRVARITTESVEAATAEPAVLETAEGEATYYASKFDGRRSASGIVFRNSEAYAAHRTYPFGTIVRVTNLANDSSVVVEVIDRGPHGSSARAKRTIIDLSQSAARELDFIRAGRVPVRVEVLEWGSGRR